MENTVEWGGQAFYLVKNKGEIEMRYAKYLITFNSLFKKKAYLRLRLEKKSCPLCPITLRVEEGGYSKWCLQITI